MNPQELCTKLEGVIGFPVTPFNDDHSLDLDGHRKNIRYMLAQPMCALVAAGGTGELAMRLARLAADCGADGVLASPPYYPNAEMDGLVDYYSGIAEASGLGVLIYSRDWAHYTPAQAERLAEIPNVVAWKDGSADIRRYQMIRERLGDRLHWIGGAGDDMVPGYYAIGGGAEVVGQASRTRCRRRLGGPQSTGQRPRRAAVCAAYQSEGIRGVGDEGDARHARPERRPGASSVSRGARCGACRVAVDSRWLAQCWVSG